MAKRDDEIGEDDKGDEDEEDDDDEEEDEDEEEGALCVELFFPPTFKFNSDC